MREVIQAEVYLRIVMIVGLVDIGALPFDCERNFHMHIILMSVCALCAWTTWDQYVPARRGSTGRCYPTV